MASKQGWLRWVLAWLDSVMPSGRRDAPPPDVDGRRDTDTDDRAAVLRVKMEMSPGGQGTTTYEPVDRGSPDRD